MISVQAFLDKIHCPENIADLIVDRAVRDQPVLHIKDQITQSAESGTEILVKLLAAKKQTASVDVDDHRPPLSRSSA